MSCVLRKILAAELFILFCLTILIIRIEITFDISKVITCKVIDCSIFQHQRSLTTVIQLVTMATRRVVTMATHQAVTMATPEEW